MLAVGEYLWGGVDDSTLRLATAFGGGLGSSRQEACGVLSGGAMILSALYGRADYQQNDDELMRLVSLYRERFVAELGYSRCANLQESGFGSERTWPCATLALRAVPLLLAVLEEARG